MGVLVKRAQLKQPLSLVTTQHGRDSRPDTTCFLMTITSSFSQKPAAMEKTLTKTSYTPLAITSFPSVPLITPFARPTNCGGIYARDPGDILVIDEQSSCYPPGFATDERSFFSPGLVCPSGYWSACMESTGVSTITTVTCCPIYRSDVSLSCVDPATLSGVWQSQFCTWIAPARAVSVTVTRSSGGRTSTVPETLVNPGGINAFGIRMVYQSSDVQTAPSSSPTTSPSSTPSSSNAANPQPGFAGGSGLSTGGTIAIAVVIPVAIIAAVIGFFLWWKSRRGRAAQALPAKIESNFHKPNPYYNYKPVFAAHQYQAGEMATDLSSAELPAGQQSPAELPAEAQRHELR